MRNFFAGMDIIPNMDETCLQLPVVEMRFLMALRRIASTHDSRQFVDFVRNFYSVGTMYEIHRLFRVNFIHHVEEAEKSRYFSESADLNSAIILVVLSDNLYSVGNYRLENRQNPVDEINRGIRSVASCLPLDGHIDVLSVSRR